MRALVDTPAGRTAARVPEVQEPVLEPTGRAEVIIHGPCPRSDDDQPQKPLPLAEWLPVIGVVAIAGVVIMIVVLIRWIVEAWQ